MALRYVTAEGSSDVAKLKAAVASCAIWLASTPIRGQLLYMMRLLTLFSASTNWQAGASRGAGEAASSDKNAGGDSGESNEEAGATPPADWRYFRAKLVERSQGPLANPAEQTPSSLWQV